MATSENKESSGDDQPESQSVAIPTPVPDVVSALRHYYVDEAGDGTIFNSKGQVIVGTNGCSRFFILGKLDVTQPDQLTNALNDLRQKLLTDPYFKGVPSMQPEEGKTARQFHAKDDLPEIRREVFKLLLDFDVRFFAVVRDKLTIAQKIQAQNQIKPSYRYHPNHLYDRCIPRLFEDRLHQHQAYRIVFAKRGSSDRTHAFQHGLLQAKNQFQLKWGIESTSPIEVVASDPSRITCLQATDYFLWALQRCFERQEHRYLELLWNKVGLIVDRDDLRQRSTGEYYPRKRPIPLGFRQQSNAQSE